MANNTWRDVNGDWTDSANWDTTGVTDRAPIDSDDVFITTGSEDIDTNLGQSAIQLTSLTIGSQFTGQVGSLASPLIIDAATLNHSKTTGETFLEGTFGTVVVTDTSSADPALRFNNSTISDIRILGGRGTVQFDTNSEIADDIDMIGCDAVKLELDLGSTMGAADLTIDAGRVLSYEEIHNIVMFGGIVEMSNVDGDTVTLTIYDGKCNYQPTGAAVIGTLLMYGGTLDMTECTATTHTIAATTIYSGSVIDERNGLSNTIYSSAILSNGGLIKLDAGRLITVA